MQHNRDVRLVATSSAPCRLSRGERTRNTTRSRHRCVRGSTTHVRVSQGTTIWLSRSVAVSQSNPMALSAAPSDMLGTRARVRCDSTQAARARGDTQTPRNTTCAKCGQSSCPHKPKEQAAADFESSSFARAAALGHDAATHADVITPQRAGRRPGRLVLGEEATHVHSQVV